MLRPILSLAITAVCVSTLAAQDKPTADQQKAVSGTWVFDQAHSDTINVLAFSGLRMGGMGAMGGANSNDAGAGGGGRGGGRSRGGSAPSTTGGAVSANDSAEAVLEANRTAALLRDPHMALIMADVNPGAKMIITANDSTVMLANAAGQLSSFKVDGRKHQEAQMDGSVVETQVLWKDGVLQVTRAVAGTASLKREFKPGKDGTSLELKETAEAGGGKVQKHLVFTRG